ncbi:MAG: FAD binding domain-containing protein [Nannocystaceae bacterium]
MEPFALIRPANAESARLRVVGAPEQRHLRAAGVDLLDRLKEGLEAGKSVELIELKAIAGAEGQALRAIGPAGDGLGLGALVTLATIAASPALPAPFAALREAAGSAATPSVRNLATLGGNLLQRPRCWYFRSRDQHCLKKGGPACLAEGGENKFHAILGGGPCHIVHPSTLAVALLALGAEVTVLGAAGPRTLGIAELFALPRVDVRRESTLDVGELLTEVRLPAPRPGQRSTYEVAKEKRSHDWPLAEVAVSLVVDGGVIREPRVALGHVAPIPWRATALEEALVGQRPSAELFADKAALATQGARPMAQNAYKVPLAQGLVRAALHRACEIPIPE